MVQRVEGLTRGLDRMMGGVTCVVGKGTGALGDQRARDDQTTKAGRTGCEVNGSFV